MNRAYSLITVKSIDDDQRVIRGIATTPSVDSYGDIVEPLGVRAASDIPLFLYHDSQQTVGRAKLGKATAEGIPFEATLPHVKEAGRLKERVDEAWHLVKYRLLTGVSIGFNAVRDAVERLKDGGLRYLETEVMELSLVPIPANADAVITTVKSLYLRGDEQQSRAPFVHTTSRTTMRIKGLDFVRSAIALAVHRQEPWNAVPYAEKRWGVRSEAAMLTRAGVPSSGSSGSRWGAELGDTGQLQAEFLELVRPLTIIGRLQGLRRVPRHVPLISMTVGGTAYWRGQSKAAKVSAGAFDRERITTLSVIAMQVFDKDLLRDESPEAEAMIRTDLIRASVQALDLAFIDPANTGVADVMPASVTHDAPVIASTGDLANDVDAAIGAFRGSLLTAAWVAHPRVFAQAGVRAGRGAANDLGARGGTLAGLPAIASEACPHDSDAGKIALIDAGGISVLDPDEVRVQAADDVLLELDDAPTGASDTPTAASATLISAWQNELVAMKAVRNINWKAREGSAVVIEAVDYAVAS